ncbi:MAG: outer membrane protein assembly factor BamA [Pseudomonadota bacterium]
MGILSAGAGAHLGLRVLLGAVAAVPIGIGAPVLAQSGSFVLQDLIVEGNQRIETETIRVYTRLVEGSPVTPADLNRAVQSLFQTGLFSNVTVTPEGRNVRVVVQENPTINRIAFEGNALVDDDILRDQVRIEPRQTYTRSQVEAEVNAIIEAYRSVGRYAASVTPVLIRQPDNRVDVVFEIVEGDVTEIDRITFVGNRRFTDRQLKRVIDTSEAGVFSIFFTDDTYNADRVALDQELLRQFYLSRGYADFEVQSSIAELSEERESFFLTYTVTEGEIYTYGDISVSSQTVGLAPEDFDGALATVAGETFDQRQIDDTIEAMLEIAGDRGFAFTEIFPRLRRNQDDQTIDIVFEVQQGPRTYIERIDISGNTATLDRVIRREFEVVEGDAYDAASIGRTADRLRSLGYFSAVDVTAREGSAPDRAVIETEVEDQLTGAINFGVTFSSATGPGAALSLTERNFLGRGQRISLEFQIEEDAQSTTFSFFEPRLLDRQVGAGFDVYSRTIDRSTSNFQQENLGLEPRVVFPVSENGRLSLRYRISQDAIRNVRDENRVSQAIREDEGEEITSSLTLGYTYDRRNSRFAPTSGYILALSSEFAGLGGDAQYVKSTARGRVHTAFLEDQIAAFVELEGGALYSADESRVRITDRFFLGGNSFKGFRAGGIGPRDRDTTGATSVDNALGGNFYSMARSQVSFPVGLPPSSGITAGLFAEAGTLWGLDETEFTGPASRGTFTIDDDPKLRASVGFSIFWDSAIGPLRLNFARAVIKEEGDETEFFRLSGGGRF